jgi:asparagine N-glycosylation enzyme membrane subunit Stt3
MEKIEYYFASIMVTAGINPEKIGLNKTYEIYNNSMFYKLHVEDAKNLEHFTLIKVFGGVKIFRVES